MVLKDVDNVTLPEGSSGGSNDRLKSRTPRQPDSSEESPGTEYPQRMCDYPFVSYVRFNLQGPKILEKSLLCRIVKK